MPEWNFTAVPDLPPAPGQGPKSLWVPASVLADELEKARSAKRSRAALRTQGFFSDRASDIAQPGAFFSDWNRLTGFNASGGMEKPADEVGFGFLRDSYARSAIDQVIINTRLTQVRQVARRCLDPQRHAGYRVVHKLHDDPNFVETPAIKARCEKVLEVLSTPNRWVHPGGFVDVLMIAAREQLTIDRKALIISRDRKGRPVAGYWNLQDGATILPRLEALYPWIAKHLTNPAPEGGYDAQTIQSAIDGAISDVYEATQVDLTHAAYVQEIDSHITAAWLPHQMAIHITQPTIVVNKIPYGQGSLLQQSLDLTAGWVNFWQYNQSHFRTNYPEKALVMHGEYDPNGLEAYKRKLFGEAGPASWERLLLLAGDEDSRVEGIDLGAAPQDLMWDKMADMIIRLKGAVYRMDPSTINWDTSGKESGIVFNPPNREQQLALAQEEGFHGLLQDLSTWFTETLVQPWDPDLVMIFDGLQRQQAQERITLASQAVDSYWTIDEARAAENKPPLADGLGKMPKWAAEAQLQSQHQQQLQSDAQAHQQALQQATLGAASEGAAPEEAHRRPKATPDASAKPRGPGLVSQASAVAKPDPAPVSKSLTIEWEDAEPWDQP